jgi:hypothetical protein
MGAGMAKVCMCGKHGRRDAQQLLLYAQCNVQAICCGHQLEQHATLLLSMLAACHRSRAAHQAPAAICCL